MRPSDVRDGHVFAGRYRVLRRVASGGMGAVFEVLHVETQRRRALKVLLPELISRQELRERFQREARVTAEVSSEYLVEVFDAGVDHASGLPFLVMELLVGEEVEARLERAQPFSAEETVTLLRQVASALDKTHAAAIVHRDLKPGNLFLTQREDGSVRIKVLDFGISKVVGDGSPNARSTATLGTPLYMAPEQALGEGVGPASDLYALGLIAYSMLTAVPYWSEEAALMDNMVAFVMRITKGPQEPPSQRSLRTAHPLPQRFDRWFATATHRDPTRRFQSATELVDELAIALGVPLSPQVQVAPSSRGGAGSHSTAPGYEATLISGVTPAELSATVAAPSSSQQPQRPPWLFVALIALAGSTLGLVLVLTFDVRAARPQPGASGEPTLRPAPTSERAMTPTANGPSASVATASSPPSGSAPRIALSGAAGSAAPSIELSTVARPAPSAPSRSRAPAAKAQTSIAGTKPTAAPTEPIYARD